MIEKERQSELIRKFVVSQEMPDDEIGDLSLAWPSVLPAGHKETEMIP